MLCDWLDSASGAEICTLKDLHNKMAEISGRSENDSMKTMKQRLLEHYDDSIFLAEVGGCDNVVCFGNMVKHVINEKWYKGRKDSIEDEAEWILVPAAKLKRLI